MATNAQLTRLIGGRSVESVRQRGPELDIDFTDGSTLSLKLAGPTGSVQLTSSDDKSEYSD